MYLLTVGKKIDGCLNGVNLLSLMCQYAMFYLLNWLVFVPADL